ncbi:HTTM domain-containing protein [Zunongwangia profunda]|uniref:HTTM domain-containing protein n=1 Tax=Zunongwangia profunda TaxID=398743 RepID=UPI0030DA7B82|tara:strand:- start:8037 stop:8957 length:921 start_codon:yes stop_codon:yes gene_type:complete
MKNLLKTLPESKTKSLAALLHFPSFFRIGVGSLGLLYFLSIWGDFNLLYTSKLIPFDLMAVLSSNIDPITKGLLEHIFDANYTDEFYTTLKIIYPVSLLFLILGYKTRIAAFCAAFCYAFIFFGSELYVYGVDQFMFHSFLFCLIFPVSDYSLIDYFRKKIHKITTKDSQLLMRNILRVSLCVVYFFSGLSKVIDGSGWWNGQKMLTALHFNINIKTVNMINWLSEYPILLIGGGIFTIILELLYPFLIFPKKTRPIVLYSTITLHILIALFLSLYTFALIMIIWNITAFYDFNALNSQRTIKNKS